MYEKVCYVRVRACYKSVICSFGLIIVGCIDQMRGYGMRERFMGGGYGMRERFMGGGDGMRT